MKSCSVCAQPLGNPSFTASAPSLTSLSTLIAVPTIVYICEGCSHIQSETLPDVQNFYDHDYKISLQSESHDQLYSTVGDQIVYRTQRQAEIVLGLDLPKGATILDFGAAKAATLREIMGRRPDLDPFVFDVSDDYRSSWEGWIKFEHQATYELPLHWTGKFDLVMSHFVLEHVPEPVLVLSTLERCLAPNGKLFFTVPDSKSNPGDLLVVDHLNHFTEQSLSTALSRSGLSLVSVRIDLFSGALAVLAEKDPQGAGNTAAKLEGTIQETRNCLKNWSNELSKLQKIESASQPFAIYGAGFYGSLIASKLKSNPTCFLDRNPHILGSTHMNKPVVHPDNCPRDVKLIYAGLNPKSARSILATNMEWMPVGCKVVYPFDE
jgi:SAM-dependent methyltransferase